MLLVVFFPITEIVMVAIIFLNKFIFSKEKPILHIYHISLLYKKNVYVILLLIFVYSDTSVTFNIYFCTFGECMCRNKTSPTFLIATICLFLFLRTLTC